MWSRQVSATGQVASLTTIIHGTRAEDDTWWRWPSNFPRYLNSLTKDVYKGTDQFQWPGDNTPEAREKGATALIEWLAAHPAQRATLIAHSHGGNVVFKATELGAIHIDRLILLGTPIRDDYAPNLARVGKIVDVYSEDVPVQWFGTWTPDLENHARNGGRTLPDGSQVTNREVATKTDNPHSELHTMALWKRECLGSLLTEP
jgi:pimeloyl-ACP methyl ester carboxylesterase